MTAPALVATSLSKFYRLGVEANRPSTLREAVSQAFSAPLRRLRETREVDSQQDSTFWALKDVSFEVPTGEVVGIIGRNGAGKSTLLKILSRIVEPTTGKVRMRGRVASLLEVGTGFHPELTGRENVYLNGSILGMKRFEIERKFDEIAAFSGVEKFLDTPVKRYSSGMYVRLAFAVAAHLEPEILIVDEVLAVGDADFQRKCLAKLQEVSRQEGRTILLVSHTMSAIESLCTRAIYLEQGRVAREGTARDVVSFYLASALDRSSRLQPLAQRTERSGNGAIRFTSFHIEDDQGRDLTHLASGGDVSFVLGYEARGRLPVHNVDVGISVHSRHDTTLFLHYGSFTDTTFRVDQPAGHFRFRIPRLPLSPGTYQVGARATADGLEADWPHDKVGHFEVEAGDFYRSGRPGGDGSTPFLIEGSWSST